MLYRVTVLDGARLRDADLFSKSDPYARVYQKTKYGIIQGRTSVRDNTLDPVWNESIGVLFSDNKPIRFKLYDDDQSVATFSEASRKRTITPAPFADPPLHQSWTEFQKYVLAIAQKPRASGAIVENDDDPLGEVELDLRNTPLGDSVTLAVGGTGAGNKKPMLRVRVDSVDPAKWATPTHILTSKEQLDLRSPWPVIGRVTYRIPGAAALAAAGLPPLDIAVIGFKEDSAIKVEAFLGDPVEKGVAVTVDQRAEGNDLVGSIIVSLSPSEIFRKASRVAIMATVTSERDIKISDLGLHFDLFDGPELTPIARIPLDSPSSAMIVAGIQHGILRPAAKLLGPEIKSYSEALPELSQVLGLPLISQRYAAIVPNRSTSLVRIAKLARVESAWQTCQLALQWKTFTPVDLDSNVVAYDASGQHIYTVSYRALRSPDAAIIHGGDNRTGVGEGDDETINLNLALVNPQVKYLFLSVTSFSGQGFAQLQKVRAFLRVQGRSLVKVTLSESAPEFNAVCMTALVRGHNDWTVWPILTFGRGQVSDDLRPIYLAQIQRLPKLEAAGSW